jgi:hypothetical protein
MDLRRTNLCLDLCRRRGGHRPGATKIETKTGPTKIETKIRTTKIGTKIETKIETTKIGTEIGPAESSDGLAVSVTACAGELCYPSMRAHRSPLFRTS